MDIFGFGSDKWCWFAEKLKKWGHPYQCWQGNVVHPLQVQTRCLCVEYGVIIFKMLLWLGLYALTVKTNIQAYTHNLTTEKGQ